VTRDTYFKKHFKKIQKNSKIKKHSKFKKKIQKNSKNSKERGVDTWYLLNGVSSLLTEMT